MEKELAEDIYFFKEGNGNWTLSIYKPLRWGIAGTAQIAEDVVRASSTPGKQSPESNDRIQQTCNKDEIVGYEPC